MQNGKRKRKNQSLECLAKSSVGSRQEITTCPKRYLRDKYRVRIDNLGRMLSESEEEGTAKSIERVRRLKAPSQGTWNVWNRYAVIYFFGKRRQ